MPRSQRSIETVIRNLQRRNARRRQPSVVLEGIRLVEEALAADVPLARVAAGPSLDRTERGRELRVRLGERGVEVEPVPEDVLAALADTESPQGIVAVAEPRAWTLDDCGLAPGRPMLFLDGVQDPGNVGTMIRTAHGLGAAGVGLLPGSARLTHPKVLRAAMGSSFHFPVVRVVEDEAARWLAARGAEIWVADTAGTPVAGAGGAALVALVIGSEGAGVGPSWRHRADRTVAISLADGVESLNAAVAAAILLYEVRRES